MCLFIPPQLLKQEAERWLSEDVLFYDFSSSICINEAQIAYIYGKSKVFSLMFIIRAYWLEFHLRRLFLRLSDASINSNIIYI